MLSSFRNCFSKRILLHLCAGSIELVAVSIPTYSGISARAFFRLDGTTGIESVSGFKFQVSGSDWYDMFGRKLNFKPTQKGVYIHNGKVITVN